MKIIKKWNKMSEKEKRTEKFAIIMMFIIIVIIATLLLLALYV
jgi:competence protein ComGC